ncbi:CHC2 zinc finger domain-containing protein ['Camptotheca acuminata' phytoplasma]|uniref:CHC2 zinc finger domain-containing protein n=1 Tax='Camptotheca acuminata' phytoplasma TaxID=3239192 RepID=UPI003519F10B
MINQKIINDVKDINILSLMKFLKIAPMESNIKTRFNCLFHQSQSQQSTQITQNNKIFCWACNKAFDVIDIYIKCTHSTFQKAINDLIQFKQNQLKNTPVFLNVPFQKKQHKLIILILNKIKRFFKKNILIF